MSGNFTLFSNDQGSQAGAIDYVKDVFDDVTLPPTNNTSLTSSSTTNPLGYFFNNDDIPRFGPKTLFIKDLVLVADRSKWVNFKPTYEVIFTETFPSVRAYVFGNVSSTYKSSQSAPSEQQQLVINFKTIGDGFGISGVMRRVAFIVSDSTAATATGQLAVDGSNTTTVDFSTLASDSNSTRASRTTTYVHAAANETANIHDYRLTSIQADTLKVVGLIAYFENSGANVEQPSGVSYVDKSKITSTSGASFALSSFGSSLGGNALYYKTQTTGYQVDALSATTVPSIAQGNSGTNLLTVTTGQGSSFLAGYGIVVPQGTSMYVGSVASVSTDTLTVSPTLPFGITNTIYRAWSSGPTLSINASFMQLAYSIDFSKLLIAGGVSQPILDPEGRYCLWGSNLGVTTIDGVNSAYFLGGSGFLQVDGYFSAAELEMIGAATFNATLSVNGAPAWSVNTGHTGAFKRTVFTDAGPGWNSFVVGAGTAMGLLGVSSVNLYKRKSTHGITFGRLGSLDTQQAYTERTAANSTLMALGLHRRTYSDQLYLKGSWVRGQTFTAAGGALYYGASTNSVLTHQYYGKNFAVIGTAGGGTLTLDGVGVALTFNAMQTVASEGFHTIQYTVGSGATAQIQAIDTARSKGELQLEANVFKALTYTQSIEDDYAEFFATGGSGYGATNTNIRRFTTAQTYTGKLVTYVSSSTLGDSWTALEDCEGTITLVDGQSSATAVYMGISKNATSLSVAPNSLSVTQVITSVFIDNTGVVIPISVPVILRKGDIVRVQNTVSGTPYTGAADVQFRMTLRRMKGRVK